VTTRIALLPLALIALGPLAGTGSAEGLLGARERIAPPYESLVASGTSSGAGTLDQATMTDPGSGGGMSPKVKAMLLSLLVPGLGQYWAGDRTWSFIFFGAEAGIWTTYGALHIQGNQREDRYEEFAGLWAGVSDPTGHDESYYVNLGRYMDYETYRILAIRSGEGDLYPEEQQWVWSTEERRRRYGELRSAAEDSFHRANFMIAAALVNRALAVVHAARSVSNEPRSSMSFQLRPDHQGSLTPMIAWQTRF